jgi:uracil-DNA glycosylase family 4
MFCPARGPRDNSLVMPASYRELLEATIRHLDDLKSRGVRFVKITPNVLTSLAEPPRRTFAANRLDPPASAAVSAAPLATPVDQPTGFRAVSVQAPLAPPVSQQTKSETMAELRARAMVCMKCSHLAASRKNVVFGVGDIHSPLMFVGEAPGAEEDEQGEPFVGKAGQLLTRIIQTMGFTRDTVYIANILKCRPDTPGQSMGNRKPTSDEMKTCLPYLQVQIDLIQPRVIVALGATAVEGLLGKSGGIGRLRGQLQVYRNIPLMPTFHPAYLLRNEALSEKRKVWEDMLQVLEKLGMNISQKQRNYFLKA